MQTKLIHLYQSLFYFWICVRLWWWPCIRRNKYVHQKQKMPFYVFPFQTFLGGFYESSLYIWFIRFNLFFLLFRRKILYLVILSSILFSNFSYSLLSHFPYSICLVILLFHFPNSLSIEMHSSHCFYFFYLAFSYQTNWFSWCFSEHVSYFI